MIICVVVMETKFCMTKKFGGGKMNDMLETHSVISGFWFPDPQLSTHPPPIGPLNLGGKAG